jgi:hypothetical protein
VAFSHQGEAADFGVLFLRKFLFFIHKASNTEYSGMVPFKFQPYIFGMPELAMRE